MPRGTQLSILRTMLKAEVGSNLTQGINQDDDLRFNQLLATKQQELAGMFDWKFLRDRKDVTTSPAGRFYPLPLLNFDRPHTCQVQWNRIWTDLDYGIVEDDYNVIDSLLVPPMLVDPVKKWLIVEQVDVKEPQQALTAIDSGAGSGFSGTYMYAYTYVTQNGETELSASSNAFTAVGGNFIFVSGMDDGVQASVQGVNVATVLSKNLYRTTNGGSSFFFLINIPLGTGDYNDHSSDSALGNPAPITNVATVSFFEVWPLPITAQTIRFTGERLLGGLVYDDDQADLDDLLIVYACAGEEATRRESPDAPLKIQKAQQRLLYLKATMPTSNPVFKIGQTPERGYRTRKRVLLG